MTRVPVSIPRRACLGRPDISKKTVLASFSEGNTTREFLDSLDDDQWQVTSFEPQNRLVCLDVTSDAGIIHHLTLTLPVVSVSWLK